MVDVQRWKFRQTYSIMKYIHRQFPSYDKLKLLFFTTYIWPHLSAMAAIYYLLSDTLRERINSFYRTCHLFECPTIIDLHKKFRLSTLKENFQKSLIKWLNNIEQFEQELLARYLMNKTITLTLSSL
jgi:hypothetical protein